MCESLRFSTGFEFWFCNELGAASAWRNAICLYYCGFSDPCLIWLLPGQEVPCSIHDCPGTISRLCKSSPHVVGDGVAAVISFWGLTTARTLNLAVPYFVSLSGKWLDTSHHCGWVNSSSLISFCRNLPMPCCTIWAIVCITLPALSSSLSLPSS